MRTTLDLDDKVTAAAKTLAASTGTTLTAVVNTALRQLLARSRGAKQRFDLSLHTRDTGPLPGVDIEDRNSLYERMGDR